MHDGITFEQSGKRALVLCTTPFDVTARNIARMLGIPDYPYALLQHPLGNCTEDQVAERAQMAFRYGKDILTKEA